MRSLNDKLLYEVMTSFNSDIFVASIELMFDNTAIANISSSVNHKIENSQKVYIMIISAKTNIFLIIILPFLN